MSTLPQVGTLVDAEWRDAYFDFDWDPDKPREDYLVHTVGYVVSVTTRFLSLAQEVLPEDDGWRAVTHVPLPLLQGWSALARRETTEACSATSAVAGTDAMPRPPDDQ